MTTDRPTLDDVDEGHHDLVVRLRPLPYRPDEPPVACRLRAALKTLLRRDRLRCVAVEVVPRGGPPAISETDSDGGG